MSRAIACNGFATPPPLPPGVEAPLIAPARSRMCKANNVRGASVIGGSRVGQKYYHPCLHRAATSADCCDTCEAFEACNGWFFTRLDCTAMGGPPSAGVCYLVADTVLAYQEHFPWSTSGGVVWAPNQEAQWNLAAKDS